MLRLSIEMHAEKMIKMASRLADEALISELARLVACERGTTAAVIAHLAEFAARGLHLAAGFPSLFAYCTEALRLSEHEAYNRMEAARLAVRFPEVLERVQDGALNLTAVRLLAPHLTEENKDRLLPEASYKSKREVEEVIVRYAPRPAVPASIRKLPAAEAITTSMAASAATPIDAVGAARGNAANDMPGDGMPGHGLCKQELQPDLQAALGLQAAPSLQAATTKDAVCNPHERGVAASAGRPAVVRPLAADRYEIRFTATSATRDKLRLATDLLRHALPNGNMAEVIDRALGALLEQLARQKFGAVRHRRAADAESGGSTVSRPKHSVPADRRRSDTRHIPAAVKRAVWLRDGGRCAFVGKGLRRCKARGRLEFHHVRPYAVGGTPAADNIQIRCRAHNVFEADLFFSAHRMADSLRNELADSAAARRV